MLMFATPYFFTADHRGIFLPVSEQQKKVEHIYIMPTLPIGLLDEDVAKKRDSRLKPYTFAHSFQISLDPENSGEWLDYNRSYDIWQLKLYSEGAFWIRIILQPVHLEV